MVKDGDENRCAKDAMEETMCNNEKRRKPKKI